MVASQQAIGREARRTSSLQVASLQVASSSCLLACLEALLSSSHMPALSHFLLPLHSMPSHCPLLWHQVKLQTSTWSAAPPTCPWTSSSPNTQLNTPHASALLLLPRFLTSLPYCPYCPRPALPGVDGVVKFWDLRQSTAAAGEAAPGLQLERLCDAGVPPISQKQHGITSLALNPQGKQRRWQPHCSALPGRAGM